jgi:hypothetical protein
MEKWKAKQRFPLSPRPGYDGGMSARKIMVAVSTESMVGGQAKSLHRN